MPEQNQDVVFLLVEQERDKETGELLAKVIQVPIKKRCRGFVEVEATPETRYRTRLMTGQFFEYREDAVMAYASDVRDRERALAIAKKNLKKMRAELG